MKIAFIPNSCVSFHGKTLDERPLGGTETAVIRLAEALAKLDHRVFVFTEIENPPVTQPLYLPFRALPDLGPVDVLISVRGLLPLFANVQAKTQFFWTGDSYDQLQHLGLGDRRVIGSTNALLAVSNWQADRLCAISGYPRDHTWILRNGHNPELFTGTETRHPKRLVYSSTPYRGLVHLLRIFPEIHAEHPDSELHIFSGMEVYSSGGQPQIQELEAQFRPIFNRIAQIPGVTVHGNVLQRDLAREFMRSSLLVYPNTFEETSCISAIEAMAAGCPIVTSRRGALPETIGDAGVFIEGDPASPEYRTHFTRSVCNLLQDEKAWTALHKRALKRAQSTSWENIAADLSHRLEDVLKNTEHKKVKPAKEPKASKGTSSKKASKEARR